MERVAIIGGGIAGLAAARRLHREALVVLIEARDELGGHVRTIEAPRRGGGTVAIDCGFIVFNRARYPGFSSMLDELGVASQPSQMSFGVAKSDGSFAYSTRTPRTLFAEPRLLTDRNHWRMIADIVRFLARARRDHRSGSASDVSLESYLEHIGATSLLRERFVYPLAGALWSCGRRAAAQFPAEVFLGFLAVHGMLRPALAPAWQTVRGGSATYVRALRRSLKVDWKIGDPAIAVTREAKPGGVSIALASGEMVEADRLILALPASGALAILSDVSNQERALLSDIRSTKNEIVVHTDERALPSARAARASWNYRVTDEGRVEVTYWCNSLQRIAGNTQYMVTLNPRAAIAPGSIIHQTTMSHPLFDAQSLAARRGLSRLQGNRATYFAGAYFGYGFHEDGFRSGTSAAAAALADGAAALQRVREAA